MQSVIEAGLSKNLSATGDVETAKIRLMGFYVNSAGGTMVLRAGGSGGTALGGTITPSEGYHPFPCLVPGGLHATIVAPLDVTFFYGQG